eukprot:TRINITY_DN12252_c0_g2_i4.p2 TRINITY_DN12252_c0_g2~~TRINITY_DN12252_c0_g2_i4.p2  ORF type:complete len:499 (+),score=53.68 TRINITY_DN12252_c0_g2_i4:2448-3944(+)
MALHSFCRIQRVSRPGSCIRYMSRQSSGPTFPLICVFGATGTGKTKLSVQLAHHLNGEIISADSIQVYKGLDIISNKATIEERQGIPHHFLDCLASDEQLTMPEFRSQSIELIQGLHAAGKTPIVVGGTHYYVEGLMTKTASDVIASQRQDKPLASIEHRHELDELEAMPTDEMYRLLSEHDPQSAQRLHPNNRRKIQRSLEVLQQTGRSQSEALSEAESSINELRYTPTICFWVDCRDPVLQQRLVKRIDTMESLGLRQELFQTLASLILGDEPTTARALHARLRQLDFTAGVLQAIGFKEYLDVFKHVIESGWLDGKVRHSDLDWEQLDAILSQPRGCKLLDKGRQAMNQATIKYAKRQTAWIRNRLLIEREGLYVYKVDSSKPNKWQDVVWSRVVAILDSFHQGNPMPGEPLKARKTWEDKLEEWQVFECSICQRSFHGQTPYKAHMESKQHKKRAAAHRKRQQQQANAEEVRALRQAKKASLAGSATAISNDNS